MSTHITHKIDTIIDVKLKILYIRFIMFYSFMNKTNFSILCIGLIKKSCLSTLNIYLRL